MSRFFSNLCATIGSFFEKRKTTKKRRRTMFIDRGSDVCDWRDMMKNYAYIILVILVKDIRIQSQFLILGEKSILDAKVALSPKKSLFQNYVLNKLHAFHFRSSNNRDVKPKF